MKRVVHRDIKADNVFFVSDSRVKVGDFGFSTQSRGNMLDTFCGSPPYAAPELFANTCYQGELVDIWAMGVMLYYMLSGTMPFRGATIPLLKKKILEDNYDVQEFLTPACQELIAGLLTKEPESRFVMKDIYTSVWIRTSSIAMELNNLQKSISTKSSSAANLPIVTRDNGVVDSSTTGSGSFGIFAVSFNESESVADGEVLQSMKELGVPTYDKTLLIGEPRSPIAGTYRILLHRKHLLKLSKNQRCECSVPMPPDNLGTLHACSEQPTASESKRHGSGGSVKSSKSKKQPSRRNLKSKVCVIL